MAKLSTGTKVIEREDGAEYELPTAIDKKRRIDTSYEIYLALYQAITGPEDRQKLFRELPPDFFDLIVVDECHRGSADEDSAWRDILEYFSSATQIGMTATPKETKYISNIHYFGKTHDKIVAYVFHQLDGSAVKRSQWRKAWEAARKAAGYPLKKVHDFRRTAARNLERAGVSRSVAMAMIGHKTEEIYRRYSIVDETRMREEAEKLQAWATG
jgi:hypothetical protein